MAGIKRRLDEYESNKTKKTKLKSASEHQKSIKTVKSSKKKQPALPSPDSSSIDSEDANGSSGTRIAPYEGSEGRDLGIRKNIKNPNEKSKKVSTSDGEGLLNGSHVCALSTYSRLTFFSRYILSRVSRKAKSPRARA